MCTVIEVDESLKYPDSIRCGYQFIKPLPIMVSTSKFFVSFVVYFISMKSALIYAFFQLFLQFYRNVATDWHGRATIVAGTAGQQYVDNIFYNPDNDYEMITVNRSM